MYAQSGGGAQVVERYAQPESVHCTNLQKRVMSVGVGSSGRSVVSTDSGQQTRRCTRGNVVQLAMWFTFLASLTMKFASKQLLRKIVKRKFSSGISFDVSPPYLCGILLATRFLPPPRRFGNKIEAQILKLKVLRDSRLICLHVWQAADVDSMSTYNTNSNYSICFIR